MGRVSIEYRKRPVLVWLAAAAMAAGSLPVTALAAPVELTPVIEDAISWCRGGSDEMLQGDFLQAAGTSAGDWYPIALGRLGIADNYSGYLEALQTYVTEKYQTGEKLDAHKATEWQRIALAILSAGGDPTAFGVDPSGNTVNLVADGTYDRAKTERLGAQGVNGLIFGLLTMDAMRYDIPEGAEDTRDSVITGILMTQEADGGFALMAGESSADITAMALQALAPYYNSEEAYTYETASGEVTKRVRDCVKEALDYLSALQNADGNFGADSDSVSSETTSQVLIALTALGIDPQTDERFVKDGVSALDGLLSFRTEDGGFAHTKADENGNGGDANAMAGEQALCALAAVARYQGGLRAFYDFRPEQTAEVQEQIGTLDEELLTLASADPEEAQVTALYEAYCEVPVQERSYVWNYEYLSGAMEALGMENDSPYLADAEGEYTEGNGTVTDVLAVIGEEEDTEG